MDEYISKQKVLDYLNSYLHSLGEGGADALLFDRGQRRALINSIQDISAVKAADVQPVKHGRWIDFPECLAYEGALDEEYFVCSECHHVWNTVDNCAETFRYCPNCGSKNEDGDSE